MFLYCKLDLKQNRAFPARSNPKLPSGGFYCNEMARWETDLRSPPGGQRIFLHKAKIKALFGREKEIKFTLLKVAFCVPHDQMCYCRHSSKHINKNTVTMFIFFTQFFIFIFNYGYLNE